MPLESTSEYATIVYRVLCDRTVKPPRLSLESTSQYASCANVTDDPRGGSHQAEEGQLHLWIAPGPVPPIAGSCKDAVRACHAALCAMCEEYVVVGCGAS